MYIYWRDLRVVTLSLSNTFTFNSLLQSIIQSYVVFYFADLRVSLLCTEKNLIHTMISNPFSRCFLPSRSFFSFFQTGIIIVDDCKLAVAVNFGTKAASFPCAAAQQLQIKDESENYRYIFM